jgi:hypothetical protein
MISAMLRRAGALTLFVYTLRTAVAVLFGWPLAADWGAAVTQHMYSVQPSAGDAALLLEIAARHVPGVLAWSAAAALVYAVLSPIVSVAWTHALSRSSSTRESFAHALRCAPQAVAIALAALIGWIGLLSGCAWLLAYAPAWLPASESIELAVRALCVLLAAAGALVLSTAYELACATQATGSVPARRTVIVAVRALSLRLLASRALLALAIAFCFVVAEAAGRHAASTLGATGVLLLQQCLVYLATTLRAACFALALASLNPPRSGSPAPHVAGSTAPTR